MTHEERVREAAPCSCYAPSGAPDDGRGPLKDGSHYPACPANDWPELVELVAAVEREARANERERCVRADGGQVELPPSISEQDASAWWQGFNYGCTYVRTAIQTEPPSEG